MSQDPYPSELPSPGHRNPYDGGAYGNPGGYPPGSPYQPTGSYPSGLYQSSYQTMEGEKAAQLSLILGLVGFFVAGIILGPLAIWQARKAERLGVPATAGKVLGWIVTALYALAILAGILFVVLIIVGFGATASFGG
ncbi:MULTISPECIES: DUF4190 domain-containing protein [Arthrobacter]|uniref:DUF4190 domain-containing protein n=1 Tax=Arthrobacter TaxID=1663 RepID=UPI00068B951E|nr:MULTISPECIES: DUF4190 domain-containing protein [Arthrobacter]